MMAKILTVALLIATVLVITPTYAQFGRTTSERTAGTMGEPQVESEGEHLQIAALIFLLCEPHYTNA
jgi:hypothetical protein